MDRRRFARFVALGCAISPLASLAQRAAKIPRICVLAVPSFDSPEMHALLDAVRQGLRENGYVEGKNIVVEYRSAGGKFEQLARLASEVVGLDIDVIVVGTGTVARVVRQTSATVPIVAAAMSDPVEEGLAASLARPGGNVTGLTVLGAELVAKRLELLREMLPSASRIAGLWQVQVGVGEHSTKEMLSEAEASARTMGFQLQLVGVRSPDELDGVFSAIAQKRPDAVVVFPSSGVLFVERRRIADLTAKYGLPSMHYAKEFVAVGGLISYGPSIADLFRRSAPYVDRILKGASPADLPIEQPTKFELVINLQTAKALRLALPQSLLLRADEVIQQ